MHDFSPTFPVGALIAFSRSLNVSLMHAHLRTYSAGFYYSNSFSLGTRPHKSILLSQLRLRMVRPWPYQPDRFRRLCQALTGVVAMDLLGLVRGWQFSLTMQATWVEWCLLGEELCDIILARNIRPSSSILIPSHSVLGTNNT